MNKYLVPNKKRKCCKMKSFDGDYQLLALIILKIVDEAALWREWTFIFFFHSDVENLKWFSWTEFIHSIFSYVVVLAACWELTKGTYRQKMEVFYNVWNLKIHVTKLHITIFELNSWGQFFGTYNIWINNINSIVVKVSIFVNIIRSRKGSNK